MTSSPPSRLWRASPNLYRRLSFPNKHPSKTPQHNLYTKIAAKSTTCLLILCLILRPLEPKTGFLSPFDTKGIIDHTLFGIMAVTSMEVYSVFLFLAPAIIYQTHYLPLFNAPYFSTSIRDFWANRWNLPVAHIFRTVVFLPV
ncbi:hypothetical protein BCR33DRAFT_784325 [Rhizoclosmatium globosum]|uniref:Wax synthase domain-containing protein n=1 Tax=Rhizoclosmatium globosum TaxID=329046 RepID=A0A1Y2CF51_9FUNG|nr:hypothetical protein BCR33DRAFT_784325 [Rhizoclosmatium globosum]|eukprot:ORY45556.1 hypothetical protein BCR33DRAFT_784325 [Rhizoclosmatium globosum]